MRDQDLGPKLDLGSLPCGFSAPGLTEIFRPRSDLGLIHGLESEITRSGRSELECCSRVSQPCCRHHDISEIETWSRGLGGRGARTMNGQDHLQAERTTAWSLLRSYTHTRLTVLCPGLPGWAGTRKAKPIWILLKQETVSGCGISWAISVNISCRPIIKAPTISKKSK